MADHYSIYETKTKLSAIVRAVREGRTAVITVHGEPVAEIRPYSAEPTSLAERLKLLQDRGVIVPAEQSGSGFEFIVRRKGGLQRFLDDRGK